MARAPPHSGEPPSPHPTAICPRVHLPPRPQGAGVRARAAALPRAAARGHPPRRAGRTAARLHTRRAASLQVRPVSVPACRAQHYELHSMQVRARASMSLQAGVPGSACATRQHQRPSHRTVVVPRVCLTASLECAPSHTRRSELPARPLAATPTRRTLPLCLTHPVPRPAPPCATPRRLLAEACWSADLHRRPSAPDLVAAVKGQLAALLAAEQQQQVPQQQQQQVQQQQQQRHGRARGGSGRSAAPVAGVQ